MFHSCPIPIALFLEPDFIGFCSDVPFVLSCLYTDVPGSEEVSGTGPGVYCMCASVHVYVCKKPTVPTFK